MITMKFKCKKLKNYIFKFCNTKWDYILNKSWQLKKYL